MVPGALDYYTSFKRTSLSLSCHSAFGLFTIHVRRKTQPPGGHKKMHKPVKYVEKAVTYAASAAWSVFDTLNQIHQNPGFVPKWSDKPLLKSWEKIKPPLGWPRDTDSLCPRCVPEIRQRILDGKEPIDILYNSRPGEIKAKVIERD